MSEAAVADTSMLAILRFSPLCFGSSSLWTLIPASEAALAPVALAIGRKGYFFYWLAHLRSKWSIFDL